MSAIALLEPRVATAFYGGFPKLREAQEAAIEPLMSGRNLVLSAGTGTGKTEAIIAPLLSRYWLRAIQDDALTLLYIAPTKALVNDLEKRLHQPLHSLGLRLGIRHGDRDDLVRAATPHVLITTPESLDVLMFRKDPALRGVRALVIDEVHLLYNTQRGLQLSILVHRLKKLLDVSLQWSAISATVGNLSEVRDFLMGVGEDAVFLSFPAGRPIDAQVRQVATEEGFLELISKLINGRPTKVLVFADSRCECERLAGILHRNEGLRLSIFAHYSSLSAEVRVDTERKFSAKDTAICIATGTLELGIDIGDIDVVVLWGVPGGVESFLQRIGRGNRRAEKTNVVCLVTDNSARVVEDALRFAALADAAKKGELPERAPYELFGAVAQQALSIVASDDGRFTRVASLCEIVDHKSCLDRETVESILAELATKGFLQHHGFKNQYGAHEALHQLVDYRMIYGNYGASSQLVSVYHGAKILGEVPAVNLLQIHAGSTVRFAGKLWRVQKVTRDGFHLQPSRSSATEMDFFYSASKMRMDAFVTNRIWSILHMPEFPVDLFAKPLRKKVLDARNQILSSCSREQIPVCESADGYRYFTFAGYLINKAVALYSNKPGFEADDLSLKVLSPIEWAALPMDPGALEDLFHLLFEPSLNRSIYQQMLPPSLQMREFLQDWLRDRTIPAVLTRLKHSEPKRMPTVL